MSVQPTAGLLRRFRRDRRGVALVEFALIFPMLVALYFGGFEVCNMSATYRKMTDTTVELANITAQYSTLTASDVATVFAATSQIMAPYSTASLQIVLSEVTTDASNNATVTWSRGYNGASALGAGSAITLPSGLASPSTSYILVQTVYNYTPTVGSAFLGTVPMSSSIYIIPRNSPSIPYTG